MGALPYGGMMLTATNTGCNPLQITGSNLEHVPRPWYGDLQGVKKVGVGGNILWVEACRCLMGAVLAANGNG